jgi:hypothetical protein
MKALAALVLVAAAVPATAQEIGGRWQISIERASRRTDDGGTVARRGFEGTLVLVTAGQKVEGTLALPGSPVPEFALSGTVDAGRVRVVTEWREFEITENDGRKSTLRIRWILDGTLKGDVLAGSCRSELAGHDGLDQQWTARRSGAAADTRNTRPSIAVQLAYMVEIEEF